MPITEKQRQARRGFIGSSDIGPILGLSKWKSSYDVWLEKLGKVLQPSISEAAQAGTILEPSVLDWATEKLGALTRNRELRVKATPIRVHVDATVKATGDPVEAKTAGLFGMLSDDWGDEGTDKIPDYAWVQCQVHCLATERPWCHVPALLGGRGFVMYLVPRSEEMIAEILRQVAHFWSEHVRKQIAPEGSGPTLEVAKLIKRVPGTTTAVAPSIIRAWSDAKGVLRTAEEAEENAKRAVLAALGEAEGSEPTEEGTITYLEQSKMFLDEKAIKEKMPKVAEEFRRETRFRVLRLKAPKKSDV